MHRECLSKSDWIYKQQQLQNYVLGLNADNFWNENKTIFGCGNPNNIYKAHSLKKCASNIKLKTIWSGAGIRNPINSTKCQT